MKTVMIWTHIKKCRVCKKKLVFREAVWKVSNGCNPKYYCMEHKPKEY